MRTARAHVFEVLVDEVVDLLRVFRLDALLSVINERHMKLQRVAARGPLPVLVHQRKRLSIRFAPRRVRRRRLLVVNDDDLRSIQRRVHNRRLRKREPKHGNRALHLVGVLHVPRHRL